MSDVPFDSAASDDPAGSDAQQPSEAEVREYIAQLRAAPVGQVVAEVSSALINAAQVKLGLSDGRLLLDVVAAMNEQLRGRVEEDLTKQIDDALAQLRVAQVDAEKEMARQGSTEQAGSAETTSAANSDQATAPTQPSGSGEAAEGSARSRLWVPGQ